MTDEPIEGDVISPNGNVSKPPDKGDDKKDDKKDERPKGKSYGRTSQQTEAQRKVEDDAAEIYGELVRGDGFDWRHPDWEPSDSEREAVRILSFAGFSQEDIAFAGKMSVETLVKHFGYELRASKIFAIGELASRALTRARQGDATLTMFILKTRGGAPWSEKAGQMKELGEAISKNEADPVKRQALIRELIDALDTSAKKRKEATATKTEGTTK